jgi:hypothetical protein
MPSVILGMRHRITDIRLPSPPWQEAGGSMACGALILSGDRAEVTSQDAEYFRIAFNFAQSAGPVFFQ